MITVKEACKIVVEHTKDPYITGIRDVGYGYVISSTLIKHTIPADGPTLVYKDSGQTSGYFVPDHFDELEKAESIKVPDEYWFGGVIGDDCLGINLWNDNN